MRHLTKKTYELIEGDVIAKDIYNMELQLLIGAGCILTEREIARLVLYGVSEVVIEARGIEEQQLMDAREEDFDDVALFYAFKEGFDEATDKFKSKMQEVLHNHRKIEEGEMLSLVNHVVKNVKYSAKILDIMKNMKEGNDVIFAHSMCVALMCRVFRSIVGMG